MPGLHSGRRTRRRSTPALSMACATYRPPPNAVIRGQGLLINVHVLFRHGGLASDVIRAPLPRPARPNALASSGFSIKQLILSASFHIARPHEPARRARTHKFRERPHARRHDGTPDAINASSTHIGIASSKEGSTITSNDAYTSGISFLFPAKITLRLIPSSAAVCRQASRHGPSPTNVKTVSGSGQHLLRGAQQNGPSFSSTRRPTKPAMRRPGPPHACFKAGAARKTTDVHSVPDIGNLVRLHPDRSSTPATSGDGVVTRSNRRRTILSALA